MKNNMNLSERIIVKHWISLHYPSVHFSRNDMWKDGGDYYVSLPGIYLSPIRMSDIGFDMDKPYLLR